MLVHGEVVGSIRTHHALPVYGPFHCFALGNGLFSTLLLYQRIVNLMAAVEGIGCHQLICIEKKNKKNPKNTSLLIAKHFLRLMVFKEAISLVAVWFHRTKQCHWVICLSGNPKAIC